MDNPKHKIVIIIPFIIIAPRCISGTNSGVFKNFNMVSIPEKIDASKRIIIRIDLKSTYNVSLLYGPNGYCLTLEVDNPLEIFTATIVDINCINENNPSINTAFELENIKTITPEIDIVRFKMFPILSALCSINKSIISP